MYHKKVIFNDVYTTGAQSEFNLLLRNSWPLGIPEHLNRNARLCMVCGYRVRILNLVQKLVCERH